MYLFLSYEAQTPVGDILLGFINEFKELLDFVTKRENSVKAIESYGTEFQSIAIVVTCISKEWLAEMDNYKERKLIKRKAREADIRLHMDYEKFTSVDHKTQRLIYIDTIIKSIQIIQERSKVDFKGNALITDILKALGVTKEQLKEISIIN